MDRSSYRLADRPADIAREKRDNFRLVRPRLVPLVGVYAGMILGEIPESGWNDRDGKEPSNDDSEPRTRSSGQDRDPRRRRSDIGLQQSRQRQQPACKPGFPVAYRGDACTLNNRLRETAKRLEEGGLQGKCDGGRKPDLHDDAKATPIAGNTSCQI